MGAVDRRNLRQHGGLFYQEFLGQFSAEAKVRRYVEVGVDTGDAFSQIACRHGIGVDPSFKLHANVAARKQRVSLFRLKSDDFFETVDARAVLGGPADLVFLDGMHLFEFLVRDFFNAEAICAKDSVIAMHDCLPLNAIMAERGTSRIKELSEGTPFQDWWTGDVWKVIPILRKYRPDLRIVLTDAPPTGLVLVTQLDPSSDVLKANYDEIVRDFSETPNDFDAIAPLFAGDAIVPTATALREVGERRFAGPGKNVAK